MPERTEKWGNIVAAQSFELQIDYSGTRNWTWMGSFHEVSGLAVSAGTETIKEGGQNQYEHQRPGRMTWPNITLKRGIVENDGLFNWFSLTSGEGYEQNASTAEPGQSVPWFPVQIALVTKRGDELRNWVLDRAFPVKWSGPSLAVSSKDIATEELEIAHHGFKPSTS